MVIAFEGLVIKRAKPQVDGSFTGCPAFNHHVLILAGALLECAEGSGVPGKLKAIDVWRESGVSGSKLRCFYRHGEMS
jgi:hypothetical protein